MADSFKTIQMPLYPPGVFDARSAADNQVQNGLAWVQNFQISPDGKLQTASGFIRPYDAAPLGAGHLSCPYKNWDWHKQGDNIAKADLEVPTLLFASTANDNSRALYMGTKSKFLRLNETSGEWTTIGSGFGQDGIVSKTSIRWKAAQLQDNIYLSNGFDPVQYHTIGKDVMQEVTSLQTAGESGDKAVAVTKPFVIIKYSAVIMLMNMEEDGTRFASRIRWSDLNDGTFWSVGLPNPTTQATSISDYQDLDYGERILGAIELLGYLYVMTDRSIWKCSFSTSQSGTDSSGNATYQASLLCNKIYSEPKNKSKCLWYPNTLVSDGDSIYYAGHDAIYKYNPYMADPERTEWVFRATSIVFDEGLGGIPIDETSCNSPIMELWPDRKEIHFSWPIADAKFVGTPSCDIVPPLVSSGINSHTLVLNTEFETTSYRDYGTTAMVNFQSNLVSADGQCAKGAMFLGVSGADYCLKQFGIGYARQFYNYTTGTYSMAGYTPTLIAEFPFGDFDADKICKALKIDGAWQNTSNVFNLKIGMSYTQMRINGKINGADATNCGVVWFPLLPKTVKCLMARTPEQYAAANVRPAVDIQWNFLRRGKFLYFWLSVTKSNGSPPTDGGVTLTRCEVKSILA